MDEPGGAGTRLALREAAREEWLAVARADGSATAFHTPLWADVSPAVAPVAWTGELADGARVVVPAGRRPDGRVLSTWAGCYGGPVAERPLEPAEVRAALRAAARVARAPLHVCLSPFGTPPAPLGWVEHPDVTHLIEVDAPWDELRRRFARGHRHSINKALRAGFEVRRADAGADWRAYVELEAAQRTARGTAATGDYPAAVFERLAAHAEAGDVVRLFRSDRGDGLAAAMWVLCWNGHWVFWHTTSRPLAAGEASPNIHLYAEVLRLAAEEGARVVDWNPSGGHHGVSEMKRRFGAVERPVRRLTHFPLAARVRGRLRRVLRPRA